VTYIKDFSYIVLRRDRVGIVGPNGCGKTSLMDIIAGRLAPDTGTVKVGQTVKIGYFAQHNEFEDSSQRVLEYIREVGDYVDAGDGQRISAAQMLERFLFPPELQWVPLSRLSGGEQRRLFLLRVLMGAPNILLLDEPTNDLDIPTLSVLEDYLDHFAGAVWPCPMTGIFWIASARKFLLSWAAAGCRNLSAATQSMKPPGRKNLICMAVRQSGAGKDTAEKKAVAGTEPVAQPTAAVSGTAATVKPAPATRKLTYSERLELAGIESVIAGLETQVKTVRRGHEYGCGSDFTRLGELTQKQQAAQTELDKQLERWAYLEELAEAQPQ
jgi:ATP-binding cassette subfamily F protein uup